MKSIPVIVVQLVHILGPMKGEIQEFTEDQILIGRDPSCHLRFPANLATISRKHAQIIREGNRFKLIDSSANGTYVNGKRVEEITLRDGDVLEFAEGGPKVSFLSEIREGQEAVTTPPPVTGKGEKEVPQAAEEPLKEPVIHEMPKPVQPDIQESVKPAISEPVQPEIIQPQYEKPEPPSVQKASAPLVIQYGATLRSYKELPVTIGKNPKCDFAFEHASINDQHAQIFFSQNQYWVKDLTGQQALRINNQIINIQAPLKVNDELSLSLQGPVFRFLGDGRLAQIEEAPVEEPSPPQEEKKTEPEGPVKEKLSDKVLFKVKKYIDKKLQ